MARRNLGEGVGADASDPVGPGARSLRAIIIYGVLIPLALLYVGVDAWRSGMTSLLWTEVDLKGGAAKAMGLAYAAVGVGMNGRSCWGSLGYCRTQKVMMIWACLAFTTGVFLALVYGFGAA